MVLHVVDLSESQRPTKFWPTKFVFVHNYVSQQLSDCQAMFWLQDMPPDYK